MKKLQPYLPLLLAFGRNLFGLGKGVVRQMMLPGRKRKGNLLSSVFRLFVGCSEEIIRFRKELLAIPLPVTRPLPRWERMGHAWKYSKKLVRGGVLVVAWGLCVLASFEWAGTPSATGKPLSTVSIAETRTATTTTCRYHTCTVILPPEPVNSPWIDQDQCALALRRWLLIGALRV